MSDNKNWFYILDGQKKGPFTETELIALNEVSIETLVWKEGMSEWSQLSSVAELSSLVPPPIPVEIQSTQVEPTSDEPKSVSQPLFLGLSKSAIRNLLVWIGFHFFAMLLSYSQVEIFSRHKPDTDEFWPFVKFTKSRNYFDETDESRRSRIGRPASDYIGGVGVDGEWKTKTTFNGIFYEYDFTEFIVYVLGGILVLVIVRLSNSSSPAEPQKQ